MSEQLALWIDSGSPPAQMSEQVVALGREWLPQARAALYGDSNLPPLLQESQRQIGRRSRV